MRRILWSVVALFLFSISGKAQVVSNCEQTLRLARSTYEQGRLHELPTLLENCLRSGFSTEQKREAYQLLTMAYIYLEEPEQADEAMLNLLHTDHFFTLNPQVDPAEFISLYNKFRTWALFRAGVKLGPGMNFASVIQDYYVAEQAKGTGKYSPRVGFQLGLVFEKDFLKKKIGDDIFYKITIAPEVNYVTKSYSEVADGIISLSDNEVAASFTAIHKLAWFEFNPLVKYNLKKSTFNPFIFAGPGINYFISASMTGTTFNWTDGQGTVTGPNIDFIESYNKINYSAIAGAGARVRLGGIYVTGDIRYQYGLVNLVNPEKRSNTEALLDYAYVLNDYRLSSVVVKIGVQLPYFQPKKLIK